MQVITKAIGAISKINQLFYIFTGMHDNAYY